MRAHGKAHVFGDAIDTDIMIPAHYLTSRDEAFLGSHCMEGLIPDFPSKVARGDVILAGKNFGCGSSREHAILALRGSGIACVVAKSFARIFFRNAINLGFPVLVCPEAVDAAHDGSAVEIDFASGTVAVDGQSFTAAPFSPFVREFIDNGGLIPYVRNRLKANAPG